MATMFFLSGDEDATSADKELNECIAIDADLQTMKEKMNDEIIDSANNISGENYDDVHMNNHCNSKSQEKLS